MKDTRRKETAAAAAAHPIYGLARRLPPMQTRILLMSQDSFKRTSQKLFGTSSVRARDEGQDWRLPLAPPPGLPLFQVCLPFSILLPSPAKLRFTSLSPKFSVNLSSLSGTRPGLLGRPGVPSSQPNFDSIYGLFLTRSFI